MRNPLSRLRANLLAGAYRPPMMYAEFITLQKKVVEYAKAMGTTNG